MSVTPIQSRVVVIIKAMPNPSQKYGETVCCAGITPEGKWKRLYPVRFRNLGEKKFARWNWLDFAYRLPDRDNRVESCHVYEDRMSVSGTLAQKQRANFLNPLTLASTDEAAARGMSLTLIRPSDTKFFYKRKRPQDIDAERAAYQHAARQKSMLDKEIAAFEPVPFLFMFSYRDASGKHSMRCGDWETSAAYYNLSKKYGEQGALDHLWKM